MLFTVAEEGWSPGSALPTTPRGVGLYRDRSAARAAAPGAPLLAVAVCYNAARGILTSASPALGTPGDWSAPAIVGPSGAVTALAAIPPALVRLVEGPRLRVHPGHRLPRRPADWPLPSGAGSRRGQSTPDRSPGDDRSGPRSPR